jgi:hypothetical protein
MKDLYVIWSIEHTAWWRPEWNGYTPSIRDAGRYEREEAARIVREANIHKFHECRIPIAAVDVAAVDNGQLLKDALEESVRLQSHYAELLNTYDGGERLTFVDGEAWMARIRKTRTQAVKGAADA